jgi:NADPH:quinone reductase-like Zn-dependent oxidoreductase
MAQGLPTSMRALRALAVAGSASAVAPGRTIVSIAETPRVHSGTRGVFFVVEPDRTGLAQLTQRVDAGDVTAVVGLVCPFDDAREVILRKERHEIAGKVVIELAS